MLQLQLQAASGVDPLAAVEDLLPSGCLYCIFRIRSERFATIAQKSTCFQSIGAATDNESRFSPFWRRTIN
jgi:hypothetical protein